MTETLDRLFPSVSGRNRFVDPSMRVSQQNGSALLTLANAAPVYPSDSIIAYRVGAAGGATVQRVNEQGAAASPNRMRLTVTAANANPGVNDSLQLVTRVEGADVSDLKWGTTAAKPVLIRFGVRVSVAGTYGVAVGNTNLTRLYPFSFTIAPSEVGIDVVKSAVIPGDVAGTWATDTGIGLQVIWGPCMSANYIGGPGWNAGLYLAPPGVSNLMATNGATFDLFDIALHDTPSLTVTTPPAFVLRPFDEEVEKCCRYYVLLPLSQRGSSPSGASLFSAGFSFPTAMRVIPTSALYGAVGQRLNLNAVNFGVVTTLGGRFEIQSAGAGDTYALYEVYSFNARL